MANRIVNTSWKAFGVKVFPLGERGENGVTQIVCDVSAPLEQHPYAAFSLIAGNANGDEYPVANAVLEGDNLVWMVSSADTAYAGSGWVQAIMFGPDGEIAKTAKAVTLVNPSIISDEEAPEPVQEWLVEAQKALASIPQTVNAAVDAAVPAALQEAKESGEFDGPQGAQGEQGQDGVSPVVEVEKSGNSTTLTITDANGVKTAEILDGQDGADGVSPVVEMSKSGSVTTLSVRDKNGVKTTEIIDGATGATGKTGPIGPTGADGKDGVSPSVTVSKNGKVTTIQIKDVYGVKTATINDGERGPQGEQGLQGEPGVDLSSNLVNGEAEGSLRTVTAARETADYKLGKNAFAAGLSSKASGMYAHSFGYNVNASGYASHATGQDTTASGMGAHAEGLNTTASEMDAHAEGSRTVAKGKHSHAEGYETIAASDCQHVQGQWNVEDAEGEYAHIVGWGSGENYRRNIHTLDKNGNAYFAGDVECGMASGGADLRNAGLILHGKDFVSRHLLQIDENNGLSLTNLSTGEQTPVGGTGGDAQADWNASEGEPGHVLNRTHYEETVVGYVIPPCTPTFIEDFGAFVTTEPPLVKPSVGTEYTVNWNGTEYKPTAFEDDSFGMLMTTIGNLAAVGKDDTGEPFFIVFTTEEVASGSGFYTQIMALDGATELSLSISGTSTIVHQIDRKYIPPAEVNNTNIMNGMTVGSIRSATAQEENVDIGYVLGTSAAAIGDGARASGGQSIALGSGSEASGLGSVAIGVDATATGQGAIAIYGGTASGYGSIACGVTAEASAQNAVAIGHRCTASAIYSFAEGQGTTAGGESSHAEGAGTTAEGNCAHAEGHLTHATGVYSHAEGFGTYANGDHQHVQGKYNIEDTGGELAHIVGNGADHYNRSNAHTLDWDGNAWFAGTVEGTAMILLSPGGKRFKITVDDTGALTATEVTT